ncbi:acetylornithine deacetylase [Candidatus Bathyarchaeota archaeon]|nr:acetylornithine deacetylase [Candidatus Bathyarchaeota archaeon]
MDEFTSLVDAYETIDLLKDLVRINSVNPSLVPGAPGEAEIAGYIGKYLQDLGMETHITEIKPGRVNAVGVLKAEGEGPVLMLNGHTDTVGIEYMEIDPLDPVIKEGRLYGRGTNDMKGGLAAILTATKALVNSGKEFRGDLIVAAVCDEEFASIGTEALMKEVDIDAVIVCEPTEFQILVAHKGFAWIDIETRGISAHGSAWQIGVDAIAKMGKVQVGLDSFQEESLMKRSHRLVGPPSVHSSIIVGGRELSTYPDRCNLKVERRLIPGETKEDVETELESLLTSISDIDPKFDGSYEITFFRGPLEVSTDSEICRVLIECSQEVRGETPHFVGGSGWMDTQIIAKKGAFAVAFGPVGSGSHAAVEYVDIDSVVNTARVLERVVHRFCG